MLRAERLTALLAGAGLGTPGQNLFAYRMPAAARSGLVVVSSLDAMDIDHELPRFRRGKAFQVIARSPTHDGAVSLIRLATGVLTWSTRRVLPSLGSEPALETLYCRPLHEPLVYPRSEGDVVEASVNFEAAYISNG